jgi:hypothetical protein
MDKTLSIICSADEKYLDQFLSLANSIKQNVKNYNLFFRFINENRCNHHIAGVQVISDNTPLNEKNTIVMRGLDRLHPRMGTLRSRLVSEKQCYSAHSKFLNAKYLLDRGDDYILIMDVDAIVRSDLSEIITLLDQFEFLARIERRNDGLFIPVDRTILCEGVMAIRNTDMMKWFFNSIVHTFKSARKTKSYDIDTDTIILSELFHKCWRKIKFYELPFKYKDPSFQPDSCIWSGQGFGRLAAKYIKEKQLYEG